MARLLALLLALAPACAAAADFRPPLRKRWESLRVKRFHVQGARIAFVSEKAYGVLDRHTGRVRWSRSLQELTRGSAWVHGRTAYFQLDGWKLAAVALDSGKQQWSLPIAASSVGLVIAEGLLLYEAAPGLLEARELHTRRLRWSRRFEAPPKSQREYGGLTLTPYPRCGRLLMGTRFGELHYLELATGRSLWKRDLPTPPGTEGERGIVGWDTDDQRVYIVTRSGKVVALNAQDGHLVWTEGSEWHAGTWPAVAGDRVILVDSQGAVRALNRRTGAEAWSRQLAVTDDLYGASTPLVSEGRLLVRIDETLYALGLDGSLVWTWPSGQDWDYLFQIANRRLYLSSRDGLQCYEMGPAPGLPRGAAGRTALVRTLLRRLDRLTRDDERTLRQLHREALLPLLHTLAAGRQRYDRVSLAHAIEGRREDAYNHYHGALAALRLVMRPEHTRAVLAFSRRNPPLRDDLLQLLTTGGVEDTSGGPPSDPSLVVPLVLQELQRGRDRWLGYVAESPDPRCVAYLRKLLRDAAPNSYGWVVAYSSLARHGTEEDARAVLAARTRERRLPPLDVMMGLPTLGNRPNPEARTMHLGETCTLLQVRRDHAGQEWGLVASRVLGAHDDLWAVRREGSRWVSPVFLGISRSQLTGQDWVAIALGEEVTRDRDGDGWSDLAEARLGTDPELPDTDGDGLADAQDRNPVAAPRLLTLEEKILAAAFEARYRHDGRGSPLVVLFPDGIQPFELYGWDGITVPRRSDAPVEKLHGKGVGFAGFWQPEFDFRGRRLRTVPGAFPALVSPDGREARLHISTGFAGLDATGYFIRLRRIDEDWVVSGLEQRWIS